MRLLLAGYCASPITATVHAQAPATVDFQLPVERASHSFSIQQPSPNGSPASNPLTVQGVANLTDDGQGNQVPTADSYVPATGPVAPADYFLRDETTGESTPPNLYGTPSFDRTSFLTTPWYSQGEESSAFFFILPAARFDDVLSLVVDGVVYPISNGTLLQYETIDAQGQPALADYGFFEASVPTAPSGGWYVIDSTTHEQSAYHDSYDHDLVSSETWTAYSGDFPAQLVTLYLDDSEGSATFVLHTLAGSLTWLTPQWGTGSDAHGVWHTGYYVSASVGGNQDFWLERQQDGAASPVARVGPSDLGVDETSAFPPYVAPYVPNWQVVTAQVGENHWSDTITALQAGTSVTAYPDWSSQGSYQLTDYLGQVYYTYSYVNFGATIDLNQGYLGMIDAVFSISPGENLMDGYNPPPPPQPPQTISFQVGENHWYDEIYVARQDGTVIWPWRTYTGGAETAADSTGTVYYSYNFDYFAATIPAGQSYTVVDTTTGTTDFMDGFNPPYDAADPANQGSLNLQIAASRWNDTMEIHTSYGDIWPVLPDHTEGFWTSDRKGQTWFSSYGSFVAAGTFRTGYDWWVYDVTTGESAPVNTNDLSTWAAPTATLDSDGDGLPDWYERLIGTNPYSGDTSGDGIPDGWSIAHGLDPIGSGTALAADPATGYTFLQEYFGAVYAGSGAASGVGQIELRLEAGRADHSFAFVYNGNQTASFPAALVDLASGSYAVAFVFVDPTQLCAYLLLDQTTGEQASLAGCVAPYLDLTGALWNDSMGSPSFRHYFLVDTSRASDVFTLASGAGNFYPVAITSFSGQVWQTDSGRAGAYQYAEASALSDANASFQLIDLSTFEMAPAGLSDIREVDWTANTMTLPLRKVTMILPAADGGQRYLLSAGQSSQWVTAQWEWTGWQWQVTISAQLPEDTTFTLVRDADQARVTDKMAFDNDEVFDFSGAFPYLYYPQNWQTISVWVGENHWGENIYFYETDGEWGALAPDWSTQGSLVAYDANGTPYYSYRDVEYTAFVDVSRGVWVEDSFGGGNLMDGWNPPASDPNEQQVSVQVGENHWGQPIVVTLNRGGTAVMQPDWSTQGYWGANDYHGYQYFTYGYVTYTATVDPTGGYTISDNQGDTNFMDGFNPPSCYSSDQKISVQVGQDHYGEIDVHLADGSVIQAQPDWSTWGSVSWHDSRGALNTYEYVNYTAAIDLNEPYKVTDPSGNSILYDPPADQGPGGGAIVAVTVVDSRANHLRLVQTGYEDEDLRGWSSTNSSPTQLTVFPGTPDERSETLSEGLATGTCEIDPTAEFTIYDDEWGDAVTFPAGTTVIDLSQWYVSARPLDLTVAASRWMHTLEVHTANGEAYPVTKGSMQGYWSPYGAVGHSDFTPVWNFDAAASFRPDFDWWLYDLTTNEAIAQSDIPALDASDASLDSDGDGLPDWYEYVIGSNPLNVDTNGDGVPDGWEVAHGLDPTIPSAAAVLNPELGISYLDQYQLEVANGDNSVGGIDQGENAVLWIEAARAGHSLGLQTDDGLGYSLQPVLTKRDGSWCTMMLARLHGTDYNQTATLVDNSTGDYLSVSSPDSGYDGGVSIDFTSATWMNSDSAAPARRRSFFLPPERSGDAFLLRSGPSDFYPVTVSSASVLLFDLETGALTPTVIAEANSLQDVGETATLIDLSADEMTDAGPGDLRASSWVWNEIPLPSRTVTLLLPNGEAGQSYALSTGSFACWLTAQLDWVDGLYRPTISYSLPENAKFTLTRGSDLAVVSDQVGTLDDELFDLRWRMPARPLPPNVQTVTVMGRGSYVYAIQPDGTSSPVVYLPGSERVQIFKDEYGNEVGRRAYGLYQVTVDVNQEFVFWDDSGPRDSLMEWFDGNFPNTDSPITFAVGEAHWDDYIYLELPDGSQIAATDTGFLGTMTDVPAPEGSTPRPYKIYSIPEATYPTWTLRNSRGQVNFTEEFEPAPPPPYHVPDFEPVNVLVGANHAGEAVIEMADGTIVTPEADPTSTVNADIKDASGARITRYQYGSYSATIDTTLGYSIHNVDRSQPLFDPPFLPHREKIVFRVGKPHYGDTTVVSADGTRVPASPDPDHPLEYAAAYLDAKGSQANYPYRYYSATVDVAQGYTVKTATGEPAYAVPSATPTPNSHTVALLLPSQLSAVSAVILKDRTRVPVTIDALQREFLVPPGATASGSTEMDYVLARTDVPIGQTFSLLFWNTFPTKEFSSDTTLVDIRDWSVAPAGLYLTISASRWTHRLEVHTALGDIYPVDKLALQGSWNGAWDESSFNPDLSFNAASQMRAQSDWWLHDVNTGEDLPMDMRDTSNILAADANVDSSGDGVPDWYKRISAYPSKVSDGFPRDWKIANGITTIPDSGGYPGDQDGDGVSDADELRLGTDPLHRDNPLVRLTAYGFALPQ